MGKAVFSVLNENMSLRAAAAKYEVPRSSLYDRVSPKKRQKEIGTAKCHESSASSSVVSDQKLWVVSDLQNGLLSVEDAATQLGLTLEETKSFCGSSDIEGFKAAFNITEATGLDDREEEGDLKERVEIVEKLGDNEANISLGMNETRASMLFKEGSGKQSLLEPETNLEVFSEGSRLNNLSVDFCSPEDISNERSKEARWSRVDVLQACVAVQNGMSTEDSAVMHGIPSGILEDFLSGNKERVDNNVIKPTLAVRLKKWTYHSMEEAIRDVKERGMSIRKAAQAHKIPKSSLADRISGKVKRHSAGTRPQPFSFTHDALAELGGLANTSEKIYALKCLAEGTVSLRNAAKQFGITYWRMRQLLTRGNKAEIGDYKAESIDTYRMNEEGVTGDMEGELEKTSREEVVNDIGQQKHRAQWMNEGIPSCDDKEIVDLEGASNAGIENNIEHAKHRVRWTQEDMEKASIAVKEHHMSIRSAAKMFNIPKSTLGDVMTGKCSLGKGPGANKLLSDEEEKSLAGWLITMYTIGRRVTVTEVRETVKAILDKDGKRVSRVRNNLPNTSWWYGFLSRHNDVAVLRRKSIKKSCKENQKRSKLQVYFRLAEVPSVAWVLNGLFVDAVYPILLLFLSS